MIKKLILSSLMFLSLGVFVGCAEEVNQENEVITVSGLNEAQIYLGDSFDFMNGVTFTSNTRGDITSTVSILESIDTNQLGVSELTYQTEYENGEMFDRIRRVVVLNRPLENDNNLILNGDFSNSLDNYHTHKHNDYPDDVQFIIDPDLLRCQVVINSTSNNISWPYLSQGPLVLNNENTYEFSLLVSGTENTFFTIDLVETNALNEVTNVIEAQHTINVEVENEEMQLISFNFSPDISFDNANIRLMFGGDGTTSPAGTIFIDNIQINVID